MYYKRLQQLQQEFKAIKANLPKNREFKPHQQAVYDFVIHSKSSVEFEINGYVIVLYTGNEEIGFKHILLRHYCSGCDGEVTAKDILNIGNVIKNDVELEAHKGRVKFIQNKDGKKYTVILKKKSQNRLIFNFFSS